MSSGARLVARVAAFVVLMVALLSFAGFGVGVPELIVWFVLLAIGVRWIVRRHQTTPA